MARGGTVRRFLASTPLFATSVGFAFVGMTFLLVAYTALETGCFVIRGNE